MHPIHQYEEIKNKLAFSFKNNYKHKDINITGILVARPEEPTAKKEILPQLDYWNYRSDFYTEFFCVGYTSIKPNNDAKAKVVARVGGEDWYFSNRAFVEIIEQIESQTNWRYDGECYLIITTSRYDRANQVASLDFSYGMPVNISQAVKDKAVTSAAYLSEQLFDFAQNINKDTTNPVWDFSDAMGLHVAKGSLKSFLLSLLPKQLRKSTKQAIHFAASEMLPK